jgi:hypothetical protein
VRDDDGGAKDAAAAEQPPRAKQGWKQPHSTVSLTVKMISPFLRTESRAHDTHIHFTLRTSQQSQIVERNTGNRNRRCDDTVPVARTNTVKSISTPPSNSIRAREIMPLSSSIKYNKQRY